ncbi:MAG: sodium/sugar symporter [Bacteroidetes bacterium]|nr:sodium/sugar symporter [Bacteroidota bacterium]
MEYSGFSWIDYLVFIIYGLLIVTIGLWVSRKKKGKERTAQDYFLASKALPWWAIGASLIASNISAEQFIGMSGSGFAIGLGIAAYEWMAAITLIIVGKYFLPIFLEKKIYTMPQFLEMRYDGRVRTVMASFWLLVYIFVNLTSVLYLGAIALKTIMGVPLTYGIIGLALFAAIYSIYGGLTAVAWTDVVQVVFLIGGGLLTTFLALDAVGEGDGIIAGFKGLLQQAPEKFDMILEKGKLMIPDGQGGTKDAYLDLPGIGVLVGGMWIANISYWGFNQYIIQRGLAAKNIREAQRGVIFAGFLKILIPMIVVIPGIAAFVLTKDTSTVIEPSDKAYPWLLHQFVPIGLKGLAFAALAAAVVSSLASMLNSTSTIFTLDIYKKFINKKVTDVQMVTVGRITSFAALVIAVLTAKPLLGNLDQAFQYIQEFTGFVTPGIVVIFCFGLFWKGMKANAALLVAILTIPLSFIFKVVWPGLPFLDRMGVVFLVLALIGIIASMLQSTANDPKAIKYHKGLFHTGPVFNAGAIILSAIVAVLYLIYW